jgi:glycosyltransferase involved in cell wall biosynthesis
LHVLVVTVVHHPEDARIRHRQIRALLEAGHRVTYIAPFESCGVTPPPDVTAVSVPRATGWRRLAALRAVRSAVRANAPGTDIVVLHDLELVLVVTGLRGLPPVVWDVHEDSAATMTLKPWLPAALRPLAARGAKVLERFAERRYHVLLADSGYRSLFRGEHPVVPNTTYVPARVPPPGDERVIYVGHLTRARGAEEMVELARLLGDDVRVELVGDADAETRPLLERAQADGTLVWHGFLPNDTALARVQGSLAGLSLLRDEPNYRNSWTTKAVEYMAHGVPVITTPVPPAPDVVERHGAGIIVPFEDPKAAAEAVLRLRDDPGLRAEMGRRGHQVALAEYAWPPHAEQFVSRLESWAATPAESVTSSRVH